MKTPESPPPEISLYGSLWVSGTRAAGYYGPVSAELFALNSEIAESPDMLAKAIQEVAEKLKSKALDISNEIDTIVGVEFTIDPFVGQGIRLCLIGTALKLEPLW